MPTLQTLARNTFPMVDSLRNDLEAALATIERVPPVVIPARPNTADLEAALARHAELEDTYTQINGLMRTLGDSLEPLAEALRVAGHAAETTPSDAHTTILLHVNPHLSRALANINTALDQIEQVMTTFRTHYRGQGRPLIVNTPRGTDPESVFARISTSARDWMAFNSSVVNLPNNLDQCARAIMANHMSVAALSPITSHI